MPRDEIGLIISVVFYFQKGTAKKVKFEGVMEEICPHVAQLESRVSMGESPEHHSCTIISTSTTLGQADGVCAASLSPLL